MEFVENNSIHQEEWLNLCGIGLGPFNLSLAALLSEAGYKDFHFFEAKNGFNWHPGMMINEATLQVSFLADLVSLIDPKSKYSFLNYLKEHDRIFSFYFLEKNNIPRKEYNHYCQWVCNDLYREKSIISFLSRVKDIEKFKDGFKIYIETKGNEKIVFAKNIVIGVGTSPFIPPCLRELKEKYPDRILHSSDFLNHDINLCKDEITVLGSGQSSAEITLELLKRSEGLNIRNKMYWITRSKYFQPMESSKLGLELFSPKYIEYFYNLDKTIKEKLILSQDALYKGISINTISDIFTTIYNQSIGCEDKRIDLISSSELICVEYNKDKFVMTFNEINEGINYQLKSDVIISGTGYKKTEMNFMRGLSEYVDRDEKNNYIVNNNYEVKYNGNGKIFIQNGEMHSHGVGSPDLGLGAWRAAAIANNLLGYIHFNLPSQTAFQRFGCTDILMEKSV